MSERRATRKQLNKLMSKNFRNPDDLRAAMAIYGAQPWLAEVMRRAGLIMTPDGIRNADNPHIRLPSVQLPDGSDAGR